MKRGTICVLAALLVLALIGGAALAVGEPEQLRQVIGGGGTSASAGEIILRGTLGQPVAGRVMSDEGVVIGHGYWRGNGAKDYAVYLPVVLRQ